jgi:acyl carrier protein
MEFEKVRDIIVEQLGVEEDAVTMEASFIDDLGADSLDIVELIMALEEEFDIEIPDGEAENIKIVADVVNYVKANA